MMKALTRWFLIMGLVAVVVTACAVPAAPAPAPAPTKPSAGAPAAPKPQVTREQQLIDAAKANGETEVVVWATTWYDMGKLFEAKYPFLKVKVWDVSGELVSRAIEEYKAGVHTPDIIANQASAFIIQLQKAGVLQEYEWPNVVGWPNQPQQKFWVNNLGYLNAPAYNTRLVAPGDVPKSWEELNNAKWQGKAIITASGPDWLLTYAYMLGDVTAAEVKWDRAVNFWKAVMNTTKPQVVSGFRAPTERLIAGDRSIFLVASGGVLLGAIRQGAPVDFASVPKIAVSPLALALAKYPPHPNAAKLLLDFLTSEEAEVEWSNRASNPTYHPQASKRSYVNQYFAGRGIQPIQIPDELWSVERAAKAGDLWQKDILGFR